MNKCPALLVIREMQIKTTVRYHFTPTSKGLILKKKVDNENCWQEWKNQKPRILLVGM